MSRADDFVIELGQISADILRAVDALSALQREFSYGDYTNTLDSTITLTERPNLQQISDSVNTTGIALTTLMGNGHGTNLTRTRR
jgi:hypothetical protein